MRYLALAALTAMLLTLGTAVADDKKVEKQAEKATAAEIDKLIEQLGDASYKIRKAATERLVKIGKPALSALKKAGASKDMEIRRRAELIVNKITGVEKPEPEKGRSVEPRGMEIPIPMGPGGRTFKMQIQMIGGDGKQTSLSEDDDTETLKITEKKKNTTFTRNKKSGAFKVAVTEGGKTKEHSFKSEAAFKKGQPALHKEWVDGKKGNKAVQIMIGGMPGARAVPGLKGAFKKLGVGKSKSKSSSSSSSSSSANKDEVRHGMVAGAPGPALLKHLGLAGGVLVNKVTGGLAAKLGLQQWDLVTGLDGKVINTPAELNAGLTAASKAGKAKITLIRAGKKVEKDVTLEKAVEKK